MPLNTVNARVSPPGNPRLVSRLGAARSALTFATGEAAGVSNSILDQGTGLDGFDRPRALGSRRGGRKRHDIDVELEQLPTELRSRGCELVRIGVAADRDRHH